MKILIPVQDEEFADIQLDFIKSHLWPKSTSFFVLHTTPVTYGSVSEQTASDASQGEEIFVSKVVKRMDARQRADAIVGKVVKRLERDFPQAEVTVAVKDGDAAMTILETARDWAADMIVLGSYGKSAAARFVPASIEYDVLANSPCKTLVVGNKTGAFRAT